MEREHSNTPTRRELEDELDATRLDAHAMLGELVAFAMQAYDRAVPLVVDASTGELEARAEEQRRAFRVAVRERLAQVLQAYALELELERELESHGARRTGGL